ncbi:hypothetical protein [Paenibacillus alkalitolerans]|uniref:hypothetical protein n=1 Tax=Paenibacillus alkalitolerans TaxID=2799335 RepID=UPI0018F5C721|nr:hypothetical protein [Paenibacillus alkalitolerans]
MMRKYIMAFLCFWLLISGVIALEPSEAGACSCAEPPPIAEDVERKTAVFTGTVLEIELPRQGLVRSTADSVQVLFEVDAAWKGVDATQVVVHTARSSDSCGYEGFETGRSYLVFAYGAPEKLETGLCERTSPLGSAEADTVIAQLGEAHMPVNKVDLTTGASGQDMSAGATGQDMTSGETRSFGFRFSAIIAVSVLSLIVVALFAWRSTSRRS